MVQARRRPISILLLLVFASAGLSGCFDGDDDEGQDDVPPAWQGDGPIPIEHYQRLYGPQTPESCEGCIPLEVKEIEPLPPPPPPEPVRVPYPHLGDRLMVRGGAHDYPTTVRDHVPFHGRSYQMALAVEEGGPGATRFAWSFPRTPWQDLPLDVHDAAWNVSLASRTVQNGSLGGTAWIGDGTGSQTAVPARIDVEPPLETLFWLGAHLWGRTLTSGERFATHWVSPGDGGVLAFDYLVVRAERDTVFAPSGGHHSSHDSAAPPLFDAQVTAEVTDRNGNRGRWSFYLDEAWPYPLHVEGRLDRLVDAERVDLPAVAKEQTIDPFERGGQDPGWGAEVVRPLAVAEPEDPGFLLGDRMASPALDTIVAYPLGIALSDLMSFETSYADFVERNPQRVLVTAIHMVDPLSSRAGERHTWHLEFTDRHGGVQGWVVGRLSVGETLLPVPERHGAAGASWSNVVDALSTDHNLQPRLGTGAPGVDALEAHGIDRVDRVVYRLALVGEKTIGGMLQASAYRGGPALPGDGEPIAGHFVQDLATRRLVELALAPVR